MDAHHGRRSRRWSQYIVDSQILAVQLDRHAFPAAGSAGPWRFCGARRRRRLQRPHRRRARVAPRAPVGLMLLSRSSRSGRRISTLLARAGSRIRGMVGAHRSTRRPPRCSRGQRHSVSGYSLTSIDSLPETRAWVGTPAARLRRRLWREGLPEERAGSIRSGRARRLPAPLDPRDDRRRHRHRPPAGAVSATGRAVAAVGIQPEDRLDPLRRITARMAPTAAPRATRTSTENAVRFRQLHRRSTPKGNSRSTARLSTHPRFARGPGFRSPPMSPRRAGQCSPADGPLVEPDEPSRQRVER